jgi:hypothetical protein
MCVVQNGNEHLLRLFGLFRFSFGLNHMKRDRLPPRPATFLRLLADLSFLVYEVAVGMDPLSVAEAHRIDDFWIGILIVRGRWKV